MKLRFAFVIDSIYTQKIVELENLLHDKTKFRNKLDIKVNIPCISLFEGEFSEDFDYNAVSSKLVNVFWTKTPEHMVALQSAVYNSYSEGYYFCCYKNDSLNLMHMTAVKECKEKILLEPSRIKGNLESYTEEQIDNIRLYGNPYVLNAYNPSILLGKTGSEENIAITKAYRDGLRIFPKKMPIERLIVGELDDCGMICKILYEFSFYRHQ